MICCQSEYPWHLCFTGTLSPADTFSFLARLVIIKVSCPDANKTVHQLKQGLTSPALRDRRTSRRALLRPPGPRSNFRSAAQKHQGMSRRYNTASPRIFCPSGQDPVVAQGLRAREKVAESTDSEPEGRLSRPVNGSGKADKPCRAWTSGDVMTWAGGLHDNGGSTGAPVVLLPPPE